jgi:hypothetical protein
LRTGCEKIQDVTRDGVISFLLRWEKEKEGKEEVI